MSDVQKGLGATLALAPVIPVMVIEDVKHAVPLARALCAGGLRVLEITLRTPSALDSIRAIAAEVPEAVVGAGTVLDDAQMKAVKAAGAAFAVSPGATERLLESARTHGMDWLPGAVTASEVMAMVEAGLQFVKFFPAVPAGGTAYLSSLGSVFPQVKFCPTGGISIGNAGEFLKLSNVICIGGSWLAPANLVKSGDWRAITELARAATGLAQVR
jgi:2-dehydro-3-deoxyphosphogluconate aldolase/(4S)-4-hydroxy-2-oxoglutarate aldolase